MMTIEPNNTYLEDKWNSVENVERVGYVEGGYIYRISLDRQGILALTVLVVNVLLNQVKGIHFGRISGCSLRIYSFVATLLFSPLLSSIL